jgi:hypothetical protein
MSTINNGGPAYPFPSTVTPEGYVQPGWYGMTLRDWLAAHATDADIAAIQNPPHGAQNISRYEARYIHADAMLRAREVKP